MTEEQYEKVFNEVLKHEEFCVLLTNRWNHIHGDIDDIRALFVGVMLHNEEAHQLIKEALEDFETHKTELRNELKKAQKKAT